ncbi:MAG: hypothetical protein ACFFDN_26415 [Candidatus Hodarchaeota archaeon]
MSLVKTKALNELAEILYDFLPGKAHPFADQNISFEGIARTLNLIQFWPGGSKLPAITQLLTRTLQYQDSSFCSLILEVVRRGISYRQNKGSPITRDEIDILNKLVLKIGFKIPELYDSDFLSSLPLASKESEVDISITELPDKEIQKLEDDVIELSSLSFQKRGFKFEKILNTLFEIYKLAPRGSFRITGEQIDGSFHFQSETYLVEATWRNEKVGQEELLIFSGKVSGKAKWSRGLHICISGYTPEGLEAYAKGKPTNIICMDGFDLYSILKNKLDLPSVLERKVRRAAETNQAYVSVRDLFPNIS